MELADRPDKMRLFAQAVAEVDDVPAESVWVDIPHSMRMKVRKLGYRIQLIDRAPNKGTAFKAQRC